MVTNQSVDASLEDMISSPRVSMRMKAANHPDITSDQLLQLVEFEPRSLTVTIAALNNAKFPSSDLNRILTTTLYGDKDQFSRKFSLKEVNDNDSSVLSTLILSADSNVYRHELLESIISSLLHFAKHPLYKKNSYLTSFFETLYDSNDWVAGALTSGMFDDCIEFLILQADSLQLIVHNPLLTGEKIESLLNREISLEIKSQLGVTGSNASEHQREASLIARIHKDLEDEKTLSKWSKDNLMVSGDSYASFTSAAEKYNLPFAKVLELYTKHNPNVCSDSNAAEIIRLTFERVDYSNHDHYREFAEQQLKTDIDKIANKFIAQIMTDVILDTLKAGKDES